VHFAFALLRGWGVKAVMVRVWVADKTVISLLHTGHSDRFRDVSSLSAIQIHV